MVLSKRHSVFKHPDQPDVATTAQPVLRVWGGFMSLTSDRQGEFSLDTIIIFCSSASRNP